MKQFLLYLLSSIVDHPGNIDISEIETGPSSFRYTLNVHPDDVGKIIGKNGKIISSVRNLAKVVAIKKEIQIRIEIGETNQV
jgi:uncharacterized protein